MDRLVTHPIVAALLSGLLFLLAASGGVWLTPLQLVVPLPLLLAAIYRGSQAGMMATGGLLGLIWAVSNSLSLALLMFSFSLLFLLLSAHLIRTGWKTSQCVTIAYSLGGAILAIVILLAGLTGTDLEQRLVAQLQPLEQQLFHTLEQQQMGAVVLAESKQQVTQFIGFVATIFPALTVIGWFFIQTGNLASATWYMEKQQWPWWQPEQLSSLKLPFFLVWPLIAMGACSIFASGMLQFLGINVGLFLCIPYSFQGVAIVRALFRHYQWPPIIWVLFVTALMLRWEMLLLVILVGLFNTWWDIRDHLVANQSYNES
ncbi:MAG: DUF2232 domain-containing protein [Magnetococcales bacterium]|nr:DUF2232 domain-containing protein [Magnetococcales bacterium]